MKREVITTADGSSTIYIAEQQVTYHSKYGAVQESNHVFIQAGLQYYFTLHKPTTINIFEMGFGTGLNALLTQQFAEINSINVDYTAIELFPLKEEEYYQLSFIENSKIILEELHSCNWNEKINISNYFSLFKLEDDLLKFNSATKFDIIYYDAFAPTAHLELWTKDVFLKLFSLLNPKGILVTYCSKGDVRRNMLSAGFTIEKLQGPPGKREMLRATKTY